MWFKPDDDWRKIQRDVCYCANWRSGLREGDPLFTFEPCDYDVTLVKVTHKATGEVCFISALGLVRDLYRAQPQNASVILDVRHFRGE